MRHQSTRTVAVVSALRQSATQEHLQQLALKLLGRFNQLGYSSYYSNQMTISPENNLEQIRELISRGVEHFVFIGTPFGHAGIADELKRNRCEFVGFHSRFERTLNPDSVGATLEILNCYISRYGEAFKLVIPFDDRSLTARTPRFEALCLRFPDLSPAELAERYVVPLERTDDAPDGYDRLPDVKFQLGGDGALEALRRRPDVRALVYLSDDYALGGACAVARAGLTVGDDVEISGFNETRAVRSNILPITSVEFPLDAITETLVREAGRDEPFSETVKLNVRFRSSTRNHPRSSK